MNYNTFFVVGISFLLFAQLRTWSLGGTTGLSDQLLTSSLSRAPEICVPRIRELFERQLAGDLKLDYVPDPFAQRHCNRSLLRVPSSGPDCGKILTHPRAPLDLLPPHSDGTHARGGSEGPVGSHPLAFLILMHEGQTTAAIDRLIAALHRPHHRLLIHMDRKAPSILHHHLTALERRSPESISVLQPSRTVSWGGSSMLQVPEPVLDPPSPPLLPPS